MSQLKANALVSAVLIRGTTNGKSRSKSQFNFRIRVTLVKCIQCVSTKSKPQAELYYLQQVNYRQTYGDFMRQRNPAVARDWLISGFSRACCNLHNRSSRQVLQSVKRSLIRLDTHLFKKVTL